MAANPNGTQFAVNGSGSVLAILDGNFNIIKQIQSSSIGLTASIGSMVYSLDGRHLYVTPLGESGGPIVTLDTTSFSVVSQTQQPVPPLGSLVFDFIQPAVDENAVLYTAEESSVGVTPATVASGAANNPEFVSVVPPAGLIENSSALPVSGVAPQFGFMLWSGGPTIGGTQTQIFEYGTQSASSQINVTVGGVQASVTNAWSAGNYNSGLPSNMEDITIQTPPGTAGASKVVVTTPSGTATIPEGFSYLGPPEVVSVAGSLYQTAFDQHRQLVYGSNTSANRIEVYSLSSHQLLAPFPVGTAPRGISLTPDGSQLVVANSGDGTLTILNPDDPASAITVPILSVPNMQASNPTEVATTNTGKAFVLVAVPSGGDALLEVDLSTLAVSLVPSVSLYGVLYGLPPTLNSSGDGSAVLCTCGAFGLWSAQTSEFNFSAPPLNTTANGSAISGDGGALAEGSYFLNSQRVVVGQTANWQFLPPLGVDGIGGGPEVMNYGGSLLFQTDRTGAGLFIWDINHGDLKEWIALPGQVPSLIPHLLTVGNDELFVLTTSGFDIFDFAPVPLSVGNLQPSQGTASGGTAVTIHGSGFQPNSQVSFGGNSITATYADSQTMTIVTPTMSVGPIQIKVVNPDGQSYSLDQSFTAQ
jgi:DNA-binding beta-propeller fold protein YncE